MTKENLTLEQYLIRLEKQKEIKGIVHVNIAHLHFVEINKYRNVLKGLIPCLQGDYQRESLEIVKNILKQ